jgi:hypothetical protein
MRKNVRKVVVVPRRDPVLREMLGKLPGNHLAPL